MTHVIEHLAQIEHAALPDSSSHAFEIECAAQEKG